jgi:hypothetical protein
MGLKIIYKTLFFTYLTQSKKMGYNDWIEYSGHVGPINDLGSPALLMIQGRQTAQSAPFSRGFPVIRNLTRVTTIKSAGEPRLGVSFDQQDGSAVGGWTEDGVIGAYAQTARHAVKCAEWCRTQDVAWRSSPRTGRAGFRLR